MGKQFISYLFLLFFLGAGFLKTSAQSGLCPSNLDFEQGDFTGWECRAGLTSGFPLPITGPIPGRHTIIDANTAGTDPFGFFPEMCPNGAGYCVRLGNSATGAQAESISYTYTIPSTVSNFSMLFYYAVVLQNPAGHAPNEQPRFRARIVDVSTGNPVPCVDFDFVSGSSTGGFRISSVDPSVLYKDWTPVSIKLDAFIGRTIMLEFITYDCSRTGHFGYAYLDVGTVCNGAITGNFICPGDPSITLNAPFGFQNYTWYSDNTFTTILSTSQSLTLTPPPAVGSVFPVVIEPFPGFGCKDTLYAIVDVGTKPAPAAGPDKTICSGTQIQIGGPPLPAHSYSWVSTAPISNPIISNPFAGPVSVPTEFILTVTDQLNGCSSQDTTVISAYVTDDALNVTGKSSTCINEPRATLSVNSASSPVQWYEQTGGPIPGATGISYTPTVSGTYWAELTQGGCMDSTENFVIAIHPLPVADFNASSDTGCVTRNSFTFTNNSSSPDNAALSYLWRYNDGLIDVNTDAVRSYSRVGTYNIKLITTTEFGCVDSTAPHIFHVLPNGVPNFTWDSICTSKPVQFTNLSNENGSPQAWYLWDFNNGDPPDPAKNPAPVIYNTAPGQLNVTLKMATLGCENDTQTIVRTVQVNKQAPGYTYRTFTIPEGSTHWMHVRDTIGSIYSWRPQVQLSSYNTRYTEFTAVDDVKYLIDITDEHTCVTTDTMQLLVLKKPGFYLPTAFTPNGDGLNDLARPYLIGMKDLKSFSVFNRGGQLIYFTKTYGHGWDGKYQGVDQATGVYVWILEFYDNNNKLVTEKGTITLIR